MKKKELQLVLSKLIPLKPKLEYEQYSTPADVAATLLWYAYMDGNIANKVVADFGCGNGILAIGAKLLGAKQVYALEIDEDALEVAKRNAESLNLEINFLKMDVREFDYRVDTVVMNPPFGLQSRFRDVDFLSKAFEVADYVYSIHKAGSKEFIRKFAEGKAKATLLCDEQLMLPATFSFHKRKIFRIDVSLWKFEVIR